MFVQLVLMEMNFYLIIQFGHLFKPKNTYINNENKQIDSNWNYCTTNDSTNNNDDIDNNSNENETNKNVCDRSNHINIDNVTQIMILPLEVIIVVTKAWIMSVSLNIEKTIQTGK